MRNPYDVSIDESDMMRRPVTASLIGTIGVISLILMPVAIAVTHLGHKGQPDPAITAELHISQRLERIEQAQGLILAAIKDGRVIVVKDAK